MSKINSPFALSEPFSLDPLAHPENTPMITYAVVMPTQSPGPHIHQVKLQHWYSTWKIQTDSKIQHRQRLAKKAHHNEISIASRQGEWTVLGGRKYSKHVRTAVLARHASAVC